MGSLATAPLLAGQAAWRAGFTHGVAAGTGSMHRHDEAELVLHALGRGDDRDAAGGCCDFAAGDATVFAAGVPHRQANRDRGEDCCILVAVPPGTVEGLVAVAGPLDPALVAEMRFLARPHRPDAALRRLLDLRSQAVLLALAEAVRHGGQGLDRPAWDAAEAAWRAIADAPEDGRRLQRLAGDLGTGYDRLRRAFRRRYGISLVRWRLEARVRKAQHLLAHTGDDLASVAGACGFAHARHLCAVFRRIGGRSPGAWRAQARRRGAASGG